MNEAVRHPILAVVDLGKVRLIESKRGNFGERNFSKNLKKHGKRATG